MHCHFHFVCVFGFIATSPSIIINAALFLRRVVFVLVFEHLVFGAKLLLAMIIYDVPADVLLKEKREEFRAKQALDAALIT
eukprot:m.71462 g.71462  ORF g.71462 m.71462 type:complete len:81 (+) comp12297_c0_seq1:3558-3800(+)